jgi:hypothetical protein
MTVLSMSTQASRLAMLNTSRSSPPRTPRKNGLRKTTLKALLLNMRFWSECRRRL